MPHPPFEQSHPPQTELDKSTDPPAARSDGAASLPDDAAKTTFLVVKNRYERGQLYNYVAEVAERR